MKKTLLTLVALSVVMIGFSQTFIVNNITYEITSPTTVRTTAYNTAGGTDVTIPATVSNISMTYDVTNIGPNSFLNKQLSSVVIPVSVTEIRSGAFQNNNLTSITIPANVTNIQAWAFKSNPITTVTCEGTIPSNLSAAGGNGAFDDRGTIALNIPFGTMGAYVTDAGAQWTGFMSVNDATTFVIDYVTYEVTSQNPNTVRTIGYNTAGGASITIPETVTNDFITYDVTSVGPNSFSNKQLNSVTLPSSLILIRSGAFQNNNLTSIKIPTNVTTIQAWCFMGNPLTTVMALGTTPAFLSPAGGNGAFDDRSTINLVVPFGKIPEYVTNPGAWWTGFNSVVDTPPFVSGNVSYQVISLSPNTVKAIGYEFIRSLDLTIPSTVINSSIKYNVTEIGVAAFRGKGISSVTIPSTITLIEGGAFADNPLSSVTVESLAAPTVVTGGNDDSFGDRSDVDLTIPSGKTSEYSTTWTNFKSVTEVTLVATNEFKLANEIAVFNTSDVLTINAASTAQLESYTIYSVSGKVKSGTESTIDIVSLPTGVYILEGTFNKGTFIHKFMK